MPKTGSRAARSITVLLIAAMSLIWGCAALKESRATWPVKEYEKAIAGRLDADYVGTQACTAKCHAHDKLTRDFKLSIHGEQVAAETGLPLVNCESCHGPGSLAIANIRDGRCDSSTLIDLNKIPAGARSLICLKCHAAQSLSVLSGWPGSRHAAADVSCLDCHKLHKGPGQRVARKEISAVCSSCHTEQSTLFNLPSHHPVPEGLMTCIDCHNAHGSLNEHDLKESKDAAERNLCARCHSEKTGPFVFEHANNTANCTTCHDPHGATNRQLTRWAQPFLCLQCHQGHNSPRRPALNSGDPGGKEVFFGRCTNCHTRIHGSDLPGYRKDDRFTR